MKLKQFWVEEYKDSFVVRIIFMILESKRYGAQIVIPKEIGLIELADIFKRSSFWFEQMFPLPPNPDNEEMTLLDYI